jgi:dipeptidyl aminopeptidase/acylaminoacyl peptidase
MQPFTSEDIYQHRTLQDLSGAPGHTRTVFVRSRASKKKDTYLSTAWIVDTAPDSTQRARQLTSPQFSASSLIVDQAGERVAFVSAREKGQGQQLHILRLDGGEARAVTDTPEHVKSLLAWSHDGCKLLATQSFKWAEDEHDDPDAKNRPIVVKHLPYKIDGTGTKVGTRTRLIEIDARSGDIKTLVEGDFDVSEARWSPDGRALAFSRKRGGLQRHQADLWLADGDGGNARQATDDLYSVSGLSFSPDGNMLAFGASHIEGDSLVKLYFLDIETGRRRNLDDDALQLEGSTIVWHPDGTRVAVVGSRNGLFEITFVDVESDRVRMIDGGLRHVTALASSGDGLVFVAASVREADELYFVDWDGKHERRLTAFNRSWFRQRLRPQVEKRQFDVPDGQGGTEPVEAWLLRPLEGDGPFPVLVDFHGGPQSVALIDYASHAYWWELVSKGWAVLAPNTVGSGGYSGEFARRLRSHWGEYDLPQVEAIIQQLRDEGFANHRLACYGKSYGGYLSAWTAANSDLFKAAVVSAPITNIHSHGGTSDTGYYVTPYAMKAELYRNAEVFARLSPVEHAAKVETATLFLQGQDDQRCPVGQCEEMFANLIRAGHDRSMMVIYPGGSHSLASAGAPSHRVDYHGRIVRWVERYA